MKTRTRPVGSAERHPVDWPARLLAYLDRHAGAVVGELAELVKVPSISGSSAENDIQAVLAARLDGFGAEVDHWPIPLTGTLAAEDFPGVEVDRDEAWGLVGRIAGRGDGPSLMLNSHVDVVPAGNLAAWPAGGPFEGAIDALDVHGRGACDMKGGLVAAIWAAQALSALRVPLRGEVLLACVVGEEDGGLGTFATLARGWRADACVIGEPTSLDLVPANAGALTFRLTVPGLGAHGSRRTAGVSAVEKFLPVFAALRDLETRRNLMPDPLMNRWEVPYPIEVGQLHAGDWASSVPDLLVAEGRYGVRLDETAPAARAEFEAAVATVCAADPWLADHPVQVVWWGGQFDSARSVRPEALMAQLGAAHAAAGGGLQQTWAAPYGSDLRLISGTADIPTVQYGPGDVTLAHGPGERVPIADVLRAAGTLAVLAVEYCGVA